MSAFAINALQRASDLLELGHYSPATRKNYLQELRFLFCHYCDVRPSAITYEMTVNYLIYLVKTMGCSRVKCKMAAQSFSFFFKHALNKSYPTPMILRKAHEGKLPAVMSQQEMRLLLNAVSNLKHRMLLSLLYSTGMRLSEMANLKMEDIDSAQMHIRIINGKGKKDRLIPISALLLQELRAYYRQYRPQVYLFNGAGKGKKYGERSIQHVMQITLAKAGLNDKNYSVHTVRHSFATHLLDNGADLPSIQQLMGHHDIRQTMRYLHLTTKRFKAIENPYDTLYNKADL